MYQYVIEEGTDPLFTFKTKFGLKYFVAFRKVDFGISYLQNLYSVDFWEIYNQKFRKDTFIEATIINILADFFESNPNCILHYVCDSADYRQTARSKLFEKWYARYERENFSKLDVNYVDENNNISYKLEFIFNNEFYEIAKIQHNVISQLAEFSSYK